MTLRFAALSVACFTVLTASAVGHTRNRTATTGSTGSQTIVASGYSASQAGTPSIPPLSRPQPGTITVIGVSASQAGTPSIPPLSNTTTTIDPSGITTV